MQPVKFVTPTQGATMNVFRILVTGSRDWEDRDRLNKAIISEVQRMCDERGQHGPTDWVVIVHGDCPTGADRMARDLCEITNWTQERYPADWSRHGKRAGFVRNSDMVNAGADICLAFIRNGSKGASMTADIAEKAGIEVLRYREPIRPLSLRRTPARRLQRRRTVPT